MAIPFYATRSVGLDLRKWRGDTPPSPHPFGPPLSKKVTSRRYAIKTSVLHRCQTHFFTMQAERRQSLRLKGESPQVEETSFQCHFCLAEDDACRIGTVFLPCCKKFVHKKCQMQWQLNNSTCALCRQETIVLPMPETQEDFDIPWEPVDEGNQAMTNRQVIERLEGLLASEGLRNQFDQVRASFFHFSPHHHQ